MTGTLTLTDFLLARIEDDVRRAQQTSWARVRVLAECHAKRLIVDLHHPSTDHGWDFEPYCVGCWEAGGMDGAPSHPCPTVRILASVYSDHPDFRDEWRWRP